MYQLLLNPPKQVHYLQMSLIWKDMLMLIRRQLCYDHLTPLGYHLQEVQVPIKGPSNCLPS
jgi:hypothetical protein